MKKNLFYLMTLLLVSLVSVSYVSCGDDNDDDNIDTTPITMTAGNDKVIAGADTITSSNKFVAYATKNKVHGWHVGETALLVNGKKTISIKVLPQYTLYGDPVCEWGCSMDYVKNNQKQGSINSKSTSDLLAYDNAGGASLLAYSFKNGSLNSVMAIVSTNHTSTLGSYLAERFLMAPLYSGKDTYFAGIDGLDEYNAKTLVLMDLYSTTYWAVLYTKFEKNSTRSNMENDMIQKELYEKIIPFMTD